MDDEHVHLPARLPDRPRSKHYVSILKQNSRADPQSQPPDNVFVPLSPPDQLVLQSANVQPSPLNQCPPLAPSVPLPPQQQPTYNPLSHPAAPLAQLAAQRNRGMRVIIYSAMSYEIEAFESQLKTVPGADRIEIIPVPSSLDITTASLALGARAVCLFATDRADISMLHALQACGVQMLAFRYSGATYFDDEQAFALGLRIARPPTHAPSSVAEYTVSLLMTLNRKIHIAHNRVRDGNFSLHGLMGFELAGKTVGVVGTGLVGRAVARILSGFGCSILAFDVTEVQQVLSVGGTYVSLKKLLANSDVITLHAPLMPATRHLIGSKTLAMCKKGVLIVNTARGALIDVRAAIEGLRSGRIGGLAMDVYEGETSMFFRDRTGEVVDMDLQVLKAMPNVLITGHQSALTKEAIWAVAKNIIKCLRQFEMGLEMDYEVKPDAMGGRNGG